MNSQYRKLRCGEIIQENDEVEVGNSWRDEPLWQKTICIGKVVPEGAPGHRQYRREQQGEEE